MLYTLDKISEVGELHDFMHLENRRLRNQVPLPNCLTLLKMHIDHDIFKVHMAIVPSKQALMKYQPLKVFYALFHLSSPQDGLVNFDKCRKQFELLVQLTLYQKSAANYCFSRHHGLDQWLLTINTRSPKDR